jgi:general secretion pathway protein F
MPLFQYKGIDADSKPVSGVVDADSDKAARAKLRKQRIFPTKIELEGTSRGSVRFSKRVTVEDIAGMARQMAVLLAARIPLVDSLEAIIEQIEHPVMRKALVEIKEKVSGGGRLADAMQTYPKIFDGIFVHMVRAGEASGSLDVVLNRIAAFKEAQANLKSSVKTAMAYPVVMAVVALGILSYLFTKVIPQITEIIVKQKLALPLPTRIVMGITHIIQDYWYLVFIVLGVIIFAFISWKKTSPGRTRLDRWALKAPFFGELNRKIAVARFSRTLSTLLNSGVQLLPALGIVRNVMDNVILAEVIDRVSVSVKEGESLSEPLRSSRRFPPIFLHMVRVGEKTGQLENMLEHVANTFDREVEDSLKSLTSVLAPLMLVGIGMVIAFVVAAVLMPIIQMTQAM